MAEVREGRLIAPAIPDDEGEGTLDGNIIEDGVLRLAPSCSFCDFGFLCGLRLEVRP